MYNIRMNTPFLESLLYHFSLGEVPASAGMNLAWPSMVEAAEFVSRQCSCRIHGVCITHTPPSERLANGTRTAEPHPPLGSPLCYYELHRSL